MTTTMKYAGVLVLVALVAGCASRGPDTTPRAQYVCINFPQQGEAETQYLRRQVDAYLRDYKFTPSVDRCDASVDYQPMGVFQGESIRPGLFFTSRNGYWSQEGIYTLKQGDVELERDSSVDIRGQETKQQLLDKLAWALVRPVTSWFKPGQPVGR